MTTWLLIVCAMWCGTFEQTTADSSEPPTLSWRNGDRLSGTLVSADAGTVEWQSPLFITPFKLRIDALDTIRFPHRATNGSPASPFRVVTVCNDVLFGQLVDLTRQQIVITSPRHGTVHLKRQQVFGLQRNDRNSAGSMGLGILTDWKTLHRGRQISEWTCDAGGEFVTEVTGAELYRDLQLKTPSEIELALAWKGKPGFMLSFAGPDDARLSKQVVKLETWDNDLVLQTLSTNGDFEVIQNLPADTQSLELRLHWNPLTGELSVHTLTGQLLGTMQGDPLPGKQLSGLYIQNRGAMLTLARLRANGWEGAAANTLPAGTARLRMSDGSAVAGHVVAYDRINRSLQMTLTNGQRRDILLSELESLDLGNIGPGRRQMEPVDVAFGDGAQISGKLISFQGGLLRLATLYSDEPVTADISGVRQIRFTHESSGPELSNGDTAHFVVGEHWASGELRGRLSPVPDRNHRLGWRPVGSLNASPFSDTTHVHITREQISAPEQNLQSSFVDRMFLRNGDVVPCKIHTIDESRVRVDMPLSDINVIDRQQVAAVEFGTFAASTSRGFADPQWVVKEVPENVAVRDDDKVVIKQAAVIGHANVRDATEISFDVQWNRKAPALITVALYSNSPEETSGNPTFLLYQTNGQQVMMQAMQGGALVGMGNVRAVANVQMDKGSNSFLLKLKSSRVLVFESGKQLMELAIDPRAARGRCLTINVTPLNVNLPGGANFGQQQNLVTLSNVAISRAGGDVLNLLVNEEERDRLLTIPRFRKQSPPTAVLVGHNGDVLRGRLISLDEEQVTIISRLDEIRVTRDRVAGVIWPHRGPLAPEQEDHEQRLARIVFADGTVMRMTAEQIINDALVGHHPVLGTIAVPVALTREFHLGKEAYAAVIDPFSEWMLREAPTPNLETANGTSSRTGSDYGRDSPLVGTPAPAIATTLLDGTRFQTPARPGQIVVLDFWASWCGPCVKMIPQTLATISRFPPDKITFLGVNQLESADTVREFLDTRGWNITVALDHDGRIGKLFQVDTLPQLVVIGPHGNVQRVFVGDTLELQEQLTQVLRELTSSAPKEK